MIFIYNTYENQYIVSVEDDVCMHPVKEKATCFKTRKCAEDYIVKWGLWEWGIVEYKSNGDKVL